MKVLTLMILGITMAACTDTETTTDKRERMSREPVIYRSYVEEGSEDYLEDEGKREEGKIYYRNYRGGE